jgi:hypothetical protein
MGLPTQPDYAWLDDRALTLRGVSTLLEMCSMVGREGLRDHHLVSMVVDHEAELRHLAMCAGRLAVAPIYATDVTSPQPPVADRIREIHRELLDAFNPSVHYRDEPTREMMERRAVGQALGDLLLALAERHSVPGGER